MKIPTKQAGNPNGFILTLWNALEDPELRPDQVYVTQVTRHSVKGPHLHLRRRGVFACLSGHVRIVTRTAGKYSEHELEPGNPLLVVEPGTACAIYNDVAFPAMLLNMPAPAWSKDIPDEHPVEDWKHPEWWTE